jgi:hypothetical protein
MSKTVAQSGLLLVQSVMNVSLETLTGVLNDPICGEWVKLMLRLTIVMKFCK